MVYIYGLVDPRDDRVKYVGKTVNLKERLSEHIRRCHEKRTPKNAWIVHLLGLGLSPTTQVIETCDEENWKEREKFWISSYPDLKNWTAGGDGGRQSDECIEKHWVGENNPACKLSESDIVAIRKEYKTRTTNITQLGSCYNVAPETIYGILVGTSWGHIDGALRKEECSQISRGFLLGASRGEKNGTSTLSAADVRAIRKMSSDGIKNKEIALRFNVSSGHVGQIVARRRWKHI